MTRFDRIAVIGTSASGKSTFARRLSTKLQCTHIELDALFHEPNWKEPEMEEFRRRVAEQVAGPRWVTDGNYLERVQDLTLGNADLIIWLDYSFMLIFSRVLRRTLHRLVRREELWNGNRESLRMLFSRQSIVWWVITTYRRRRRNFPTMLRVRYASTPHLRFRAPKEAEAWLVGVARARQDHSNR